MVIPEGWCLDTISVFSLGSQKIGADSEDTLTDWSTSLARYTLLPMSLQNGLCAMAPPAPSLETCRHICQLQSDLAQELRPLQKKPENVQLSSTVFLQKHHLPILTGRGNNMTALSSGGVFWQFTGKAGNWWVDVHSGVDPLGSSLSFWQHIGEKHSNNTVNLEVFKTQFIPI